jgi:hypothetical protein
MTPCEAEVGHRVRTWTTQTMSDSEQDTSVLGKRARNGPEADVSEEADMNPPSATQDDDDSDDEAHERFVTTSTTAWSCELSKPHEGIAAAWCLPLIPNNVGYSTKTRFHPTPR